LRGVAKFFLLLAQSDQVSVYASDANYLITVLRLYLSRSLARLVLNSLSKEIQNREKVLKEIAEIQQCRERFKVDPTRVHLCKELVYFVQTLYRLYEQCLSSAVCEQIVHEYIRLIVLYDFQVSVIDVLCMLSYDWVYTSYGTLDWALKQVSRDGKLLFLLLRESRLDQVRELIEDLKPKVKTVVLVDSPDKADVVLEEPNILEFAQIMDDMKEFLGNWDWSWRLLPVLFVLDKELHLSFTQKMDFVTSRGVPTSIDSFKAVVWWNVSHEINENLKTAKENKRELVCSLYEKVSRYPAEIRIPALLALAMDAYTNNCPEVFEALSESLGDKLAEEVKYLILAYLDKSLDLKVSIEKKEVREEKKEEERAEEAKEVAEEKAEEEEREEQTEESEQSEAVLPLEELEAFEVSEASEPALKLPNLEPEFYRPSVVLKKVRRRRTSVKLDFLAI